MTPPTRLSHSVLLSCLLIWMSLGTGCRPARGAAADAGPLRLTGCSLGCTGDDGGGTIGCTITQIHPNQTIVLSFSAPLDPASIDAFSCRLVDALDGSRPEVDIGVDPGDARRLILRPRLSFDPTGVPRFGLRELATYDLRIPSREEQARVLRSSAGRLNESTLHCTFSVRQDWIDPMPGAPRLELFVETTADSGPDRSVLDPDVQSGAARVRLRSSVRVVFDDLMDLSTLLDPASGLSNRLVFELDDDGLPETDHDRSPLPGRFDVELDEARATTTVSFRHEWPASTGGEPIATFGFPPAGRDPAHPRRIVLRVAEGVTDLVGNAVALDPDERTRAFVCESSAHPAFVLPRAREDQGDPFDPGAGAEEFELGAGAGEDSLEDRRTSSAAWGGGRLAPGHGGGSGRLGELRLAPGEVLLLDTDEQRFPLVARAPDLIANTDEFEALRETIVRDGCFEFSRVRLEPGSTLAFRGSRPARVFSRGAVWVAPTARIELGGEDAPAHDSVIADPAVAWDGTGLDPRLHFGIDEPATIPPAGGPGAGAGGLGGTRWNTQGLAALPLEVGFLKDGGFRAGWSYLALDGERGQGLGGRDDASAPAWGAGAGGPHWPERLPSGPTVPEAGELRLTELYDSWLGEPACFVRMVGGVGAGGAYALPGAAGEARGEPLEADHCLDCGPEPLLNAPAVPAGPTPVPALVAADPPGGPNFESTGYELRRLTHSRSRPPGHLRGGAGGGGGGQHPFGSYTDGDQLQVPDCLAPDARIANWPAQETNPRPGWLDHSGAAGGGGGGALQLVSGGLLRIDGVIDARGGAGGSPAGDSASPYGSRAMPGGGGSGGAVRLQAVDVELGEGAGRIDVRGGRGGVAAPDWGSSTGGDGGAGLVRIETLVGGPPAPGGEHHDEFDDRVLPYDPNADGHSGAYGPFSLDFLSVERGGWHATDEEPPGTYSGSTSCWFRPPGAYDWLGLAPDPPGEQDPTALAWNMEVLLDWRGQPLRLPFRGANDWFEPLEDLWGNELRAGAAPDGFGPPRAGRPRSPIVVRFQGVRLLHEPADRCALDLDLEIEPGSLTPWLRHPALLEPDPDAGRDWPRPNAMRFTVLFDAAAAPLREGWLVGVDRLWIRAAPD